MATNGLEWGVILTKPNHEKRACKHLHQQGFDFYFPRTICRIKNNQRRTVPLFPRYVFVQLKWRWYCLLGTFGISRVLFAGDRPAVVQHDLVEAIRNMENQNGIVTMPQHDDHFHVDQQVQITNGVFRGLVGLYKGQSSRQRERVLLTHLGLVDLSAGNLVAV